MTDFIADLEAELVAAARRRSRRRVPRPRLVPVVAAVAIALAAFAVLRGMDGSRTADDRPLPPPRSGVVVTLPAAESIPDDAGCRAGLGAAIRGAVQLAVFERPQGPQDRRPPASFGALPADFVDEDSLRAPGGAAGLHIIRVAGMSGPCGAQRPARDPGVCLIVGAESVAARCFGDEQVARGTAIATAPAPSAPAGWVYGIVPDGVDRVTLSWSGGTLTPNVVENTYAARLAGVKPGDQVRVELVPPVRCEPSPAVYHAVPALIEGRHADPPRDLETAMARRGGRGAWRAFARVLTGRDDVQVWVVPDMPCDRAAGGDERVCVFSPGGSLVCQTPASLRHRGAWMRFGDGAAVTVAGIAPSGSRYADVRIRDTVFPVRVSYGVFGTMLVDRLGDPVHITYR